MAAPKFSTDELRRLYEIEKRSLRQIARRFGVSIQAVHLRRKEAGIELRKLGGSMARKFNIELIKRLYLDERKSCQAIASQLKTKPRKISELLKENGVEMRKPADWLRKYESFETLNIGESVRVPKPTSRGKWQGRFYKNAKGYGIRISIRTIDDMTIELIRTE